MNTIDTLAEKYLDALNAGQAPDVAFYLTQVEDDEQEALRRRLRFVDLMHRSRPTGGAA